MANINLLPWREERRARLKQQFFIVLVVAAVIGVGSVVLYNLHLKNKIEIRRQENSFIEAETAKLEEDIKEIENIKNQRERLIERMEVIENLQGNRSVIVHQFDEMVRVVPDGVYMTAVSKKGETFHMEGIADANNRVSNLMLNLDESDWFKNSILASVTAAEDEAEEKATSSFKLSVSEENPNVINEDEDS